MICRKVRPVPRKEKERPELAGPKWVGVWGPEVQGLRSVSYSSEPGIFLLVVLPPCQRVEVGSSSPCKLEWVTFQHMGAADTDTASTLL